MKPIDWCDANGKSTAELIQILRVKFPRYGNAANSMCNHPEEYGVKLTPDAERWLCGKGPKQEPRRVRSCRFTFRLFPIDAAAFEAVRLKHGHTVQEATEKAVMLYIQSMEGGG